MHRTEKKHRPSVLFTRFHWHHMKLRSRRAGMREILRVAHKIFIDQGVRFTGIKQPSPLPPMVKPVKFCRHRPQAFTPRLRLVRQLLIIEQEALGALENGFGNIDGEDEVFLVIVKQVLRLHEGFEHAVNNPQSLCVPLLVRSIPSPPRA